jgi:DNA helicase HerA-like ATPase
MIELARFASAHPSRELQAVIMLDEADLYLPAIGKPASKQPLENALRRFRSNGIGIMLATQSPGDIDYRCRENIQTWLVGRVKEARAIEKLSLVFGPDGGKLLEKLGQHATGEFCMVRPDALTKFQAEMNLLRTEQMSDAEILHASKKTMR